MNLTVVIKCSDDNRIWRCIESIDAKAEIVAAITPNPEMEKRLKAMGIKYVRVPRGNIALTANAGAEMATRPKLIIMDSDAYFGRGAVGIINRALDHHPVVKPRIIWHHDGTKLGQIISLERDAMNRDQLVAYTPGLGIRKDILPRIGGSVFNNYVRWAEDAELTWRLKRYGVPIYPVDRALIHHDPTTFRHELKVAIRVGAGKRLGVDFAGREPDEDLINVAKRFFKGRQLIDLVGYWRKGGPAYTGFRVLWNLAYYWAYNVQKYLKVYSPTPDLLAKLKK